MENENVMQVWSVMGGWDDEGFDGDSLKLFYCNLVAQSYRRYLLKGNYDYVECKSMRVC